MRVVWTEPALDDVDHIQDYIGPNNPVAAYKVASVIKQAVKLLADHPMIGRTGRVSGSRELVVSGTSYIVAYRVRDAVEILAVIHGAQEWPKEF